MSEVNLQWEFAVAVMHLIGQARVLGYNVTLGEAYRTPEQAKLDAAKGTGIVDSLHCERLAIDLNLFTRGGEYLTGAEGYTELGTWWKKQGLNYRWGGDFTTRDYDHFSLSPDGRRA